MPETVEVCRLCLSKERLMLPIFRNRISVNETSFRTKVMSCASIEIFADDDLPSKVCYLCVHQVEKFFQFQAMCENSDLVLRSKLKKKNVLNEVDHDVKNISVQEANKRSENYNLLPNQYSVNNHDKKMNFDELTCNTCTSIFLTNNLLIDHLLKNHPDLNLFFCKSCKVAFSHVNQFKNHLTLQHSLTCSHCDCVFKNEKNLKDHLKIHIGKTLTCKFCSKTFLTVHDMKKHELVHLERTCSYCTTELDSKNDYSTHLKECDQRYHCKFCQQLFELKKDLINHVNCYHESCSLQECDKCQKISISSEIQEEKYVNKEDQTFQERSCQTQCIDKPSLVNKKRIKHNIIFSCKFCTKNFHLRSSLKRHEKSHSGLKPYQCKFCPRKFKDSSACVVHTRTHTGEHPFRCKECQKNFKQLANLKMHIYRHHKKSNISEALNEDGKNYENLFTRDVIESYSGDSLRGYQDLGETLTVNFNQDINILMPEHQSA